MLPDFPKLKRDIHKFFLERKFEEGQYSDSLVARVKHYLQHEGDNGSYETVDGKKKEKDYQKFEATYLFTADEIINSGFEEILQKFYNMGLDASSKIAQHSFKVIGEAIDEVGNNIKADGPLTKEFFLEALRKILIDFDNDTGEPQMPTVYIHPIQAEGIRKMAQETDNDPQFKAEYEKILKQKRQEYDDREANRKLVD